MKIRYINYGTGNRVGDTIYLNKDLKKYPILHDAILDHEKKHTGGFKLKDFLLDFKNRELEKVKGQWFKFLFKYPRAWANFLPVLKLGNKWCIDIAITLVWSLITAMFVIILIIWQLI